MLLVIHSIPEPVYHKGKRNGNLFLRRMKKIYTVNDYCREKFGKKLYKLSLDGGFTCPTRDGTLGVGGCVFCSRVGSGEFAARGEDIAAQIEAAKRRVADKFRDGDGYIAYFQSFTNTYAPVERLRELFTRVIARNDIEVLAVATRPDCLEEEKIALLRELNAVKPVWVELGLQTTKESSVRFIRRGYDNSVYDDAVKRLQNAGIYVITHMIAGLPGETLEDMKNTVRHIVAAGSDGIKIHLLHVLRDADLYDYWLRGEVKTLTKEEYLQILSKLLELLPEKTAVHRLTGDGDKRTLVAPLWSADKKDVMNSIKNYGADNMAIPDYVRAVLDTLEQNGFAAYLVGGCVRDHLLDHAPGDYDMAVASSPEETERCFAGWRLIETGIRHGTVTVVSDGHNLELTTFRCDGEYKDSRRPESVAFTRDIHADVARRDFTVNAMAYSPTRGYVDDFGGREDLQAKVIRCVGEPELRFTEDALRIMRALRFAAVLDFTIEKKTAEAALALRERLNNISAERIFVELKKLLAGPNAEKILLQFRPVIKTVLPETAALSAAEYARNARCVKRCADDPMRLAALLYGVSPDTAEAVCKRLRSDNKFRISLRFYIENADRAFRSAGEAKRLAGEKGPDRLAALLAFRRAMGLPEDDNLTKAVAAVTRGDECLTLKSLAVGGDDITALGADGREVGKILNALLAEVTEGRLPNEREALLQAARNSFEI